MANKPRILLLIPASSYRAGDFLDAAAQLGVLVTVGSDHRQVLAKLAPAGNLYVDFDQLPRSVAAICSFADSFALHAIVGTDDRALELAAEASLALGLPHNAPHAIRAAADKLRFRELSVAAGIPAPAFARVHTAAEAAQAAAVLGFPCVLKPRSLAASQGVIRVDDECECRRAAQRVFRLLEKSYPPRHPHRRSLLLEQFLPGREYAIDGLLVNGTFEALAVFDKPEPMNGPFFEETLFITPSRAPASVIAAMMDSVAAAATAIGLTSGPIHAEFRVDHGAARRTPMLLEIAPRSIGGRCSKALAFEAGLSLEGIILEAALGRARARTPSHRARGVMMVPIPASGVLRSVKGVQSAKSVTGIGEVIISIGPGERVRAVPEGNRYLGFIFAQGNHPDEVEAALRTAHEHLAFDIERVDAQP